uniref:Uncharacterized protein n=1 Tax=Chromera velia CCMP2878 TaxID=1169474 RepID=A0A0G4G285_9ALVE|eukprot:Cvel_19870.t1-p1 / transcript=Cvel_19870.t1 / gene=Cvel_19870 / organism=Chromera_velia_CCMP2878 / gene_product=hypothetical protein / transcript_product=hypothetical protein / location=Cvel_scaffold1742:35617-38452(-) / protein_length=763 / sequence_SO=supercontig / SO=protein_coding / is_pseudo=false
MTIKAGRCEGLAGGEDMKVEQQNFLQLATQVDSRIVTSKEDLKDSAFVETASSRTAVREEKEANTQRGGNQSQPQKKKPTTSSVPSVAFEDRIDADEVLSFGFSDSPPVPLFSTSMASVKRPVGQEKEEQKQRVDGQQQTRKGENTTIQAAKSVTVQRIEGCLEEVSRPFSFPADQKSYLPASSSPNPATRETPSGLRSQHEYSGVNETGRVEYGLRATRAMPRIDVHQRRERAERSGGSDLQWVQGSEQGQQPLPLSGNVGLGRGIGGGGDEGLDGPACFFQDSPAFAPATAGIAGPRIAPRTPLSGCGFTPSPGQGQAPGQAYADTERDRESNGAPTTATATRTPNHHIPRRAQQPLHLQAHVSEGPVTNPRFPPFQQHQWQQEEGEQSLVAPMPPQPTYTRPQHGMPTTPAYHSLQPIHVTVGGAELPIQAQQNAGAVTGAGTPGGPPNPNPNQHQVTVAEGQTEPILQIPAHFVPRLIGGGGKCDQDFQDRSGASLKYDRVTSVQGTSGRGGLWGGGGPNRPKPFGFFRTVKQIFTETHNGQEAVPCRPNQRGGSKAPPFALQSGPPLPPPKTGFQGLIEFPTAPPSPPFRAPREEDEDSDGWDSVDAIPVPPETARKCAAASRRDACGPPGRAYDWHHNVPKSIGTVMNGLVGCEKEEISKFTSLCRDHHNAIHSIGEIMAEEEGWAKGKVLIEGSEQMKRLGNLWLAKNAREEKQVVHPIRKGEFSAYATICVFPTLSYLNFTEKQRRHVPEVKSCV